MLLLLLPVFPAGAQFSVTPPDARSAAMGGCRLMDDGNHLTISYRSGFVMTAMATRGLDLGWRLGEQGYLGAAYSFFGDADYNEQQCFLSGSMQVDEWIAVGVGGRYCRMQVDDGHYDAHQWVGLSAMARFSIGKQLKLTVEGGSRPWDDSRPWRALVALAYSPVSDLLTLVQVETEECWRIRCGAEYCYRRHFLFRCGLATAPLALTFGLGFHYDSYRIDFAVENHNTLGPTPQISLGLWF